MSKLMQPDMNDALARVMRDVSPVSEGLGLVRVRLVSPQDGSPEVADDAWLVGLPPGSCRWVLHVGDSQTALDDDTPADLTASIASYLQDRIIDETSKPWPEAEPYGVLDAKVVNGIAYWCSHETPVVPVGEFATLTPK